MVRFGAETGQPSPQTETAFRGTEKAPGLGREPVLDCRRGGGGIQK